MVVFTLSLTASRVAEAQTEEVAEAAEAPEGRLSSSVEEAEVVVEPVVSVRLAVVAARGVAAPSASFVLDCHPLRLRITRFPLPLAAKAAPEGTAP